LGAAEQVPAPEGAQVPAQQPKPRLLPEEIETDIVTREAYCRWAKPRDTGLRTRFYADDGPAGVSSRRF
jgi:hypothetical protein